MIFPVGLYKTGFIEKIKTFSYNKKDLACGIESNAMCVTAIPNYWIYY
jgi:hypothetical protein